jgi:uncharacterized protein YbaR (Trm112 family)
MRDDLMELICCPECRADLLLVATQRDATNEILEGTLTCSSCGHVYPIHDGIPNLLPPSVEGA